MTPYQIFNLFILISFAAALVVFIALFFINAPYGRHSRGGWGPVLSNRVGWLIMESPSALIFLAAFVQGGVPKNIVLVVFFLMWEAHYVHRAFIYPLMLTSRRRVMPLAVMLMAIFFNVGNAYTNGWYLFEYSRGYPLTWLSDPRFIAGFILFAAGYALNRWSDWTLRNLRKPGDEGYRVPQGGLFRWVSCPNYLGEIIEWAGWAVATWSLPGLAFAVWTFANLAPRARANHRWYRAQFADYPRSRKALIPGIW